LSHIVPEIDFLDVFNFNLFSLQIELRHELTNVQVTPKTDVMQLTIKTQEISKAFSLRPITSSSQDQGLLSRYAAIEVLGCHNLWHPNRAPWGAFIAFSRHSSPWW
jgi:hypothetical protein